MNAVNTLFIFRSVGGVWVFDDEAHGLVREPFVGVINNIFDEITKHIPDAANGVNLTFSANRLPYYDDVVSLETSDASGSYYYSERFNSTGWLCPALFHYFDTAPEKIYFKITPKG